jgi:hypothetical protein
MLSPLFWVFFARKKSGFSPRRRAAGLAAACLAFGGMLFAVLRRPGQKFFCRLPGREFFSSALPNAAIYRAYYNFLALFIIIS